MSNLIHRQDLSFSFNDAAKALRTEALTLAVEIESVANPEEQATAVEAMKKLHEFAAIIENARKDIKQPVLDAGRAIDALAKEFTANVYAERARVGRLVGDYQQAEIAKVKAAEAARVEELSRIERDTQEKLAQANTIPEREAIRERAMQEVQAVPVAPTPPRVEDQRVTEDWEFEVVDKRELATWHPDMVTIEPRRQEIKDALKSGRTIRGIKAWPVTKASVRVGRTKEIAVVAI
jgi:hypothetical protein